MRKTILSLLSLLAVLPLAAQQTDDLEQLQKFTRVYRYLTEFYVDEEPMGPVVEGAIEGMLERLDPHSAYLTAEEMRGVRESLDGEFSGIGVEFNVLRDTVVVVNTIAGGPAERAGMRANDRIVRIAWRDSSCRGAPWLSRPRAAPCLPPISGRRAPARICGDGWSS